MKHTIFTIITPVEPCRVGDLQSNLSGMGYLGSAPANDPLNFEAVSMLHFASLFLYDDPAEGRWFLVFESNIDGDIERYLDEVIRLAKDREEGCRWLEVYRACTGFDQGTLEELKSFWLSHLQMPAAAYSGARGRSRDQILLERRVHETADQALAFDGSAVSAPQAASKVRDALDAGKDADAYKEPFGGASVSTWIATARQALFDLALLIVSVVALLFLIPLNRLKEATARQDTWRPDGCHVRSQRAREDFLPTNHMVSVVHLHTDGTRLLSKKAGFAVLNLLSRYVYRHGKLGSIPTIHFAHWSIVNEGRRLLFVSNYDGSWDSYLDDFTLKAARGLTLAWCHGIGFPRSKYMLFGGAANGPEFIDWARRSMVPTLVWYSAYQYLSVANINRNTALRKAIAADENAVNDGNWLGRV